MRKKILCPEAHRNITLFPLGAVVVQYSLIQCSWSVSYRSQPNNNQCCGWVNPCGSYYGFKSPFNNNHQKNLKRYWYFLQDLEITQHTWRHTLRSQVESKRVFWAGGASFIGVKGRSLGIWGLSIYWWF